ncbi:hypothetical protein TSMEX_009691 [Taenia solium]|eukprot:TsM_000141700 transcript=TsM_000141700 gene=TsM_000141700
MAVAILYYCPNRNSLPVLLSPRILSIFEVYIFKHICIHYVGMDADFIASTGRDCASTVSVKPRVRLPHSRDLVPGYVP